MGPSIASGSQTWSGNWADFPMAPQKIPIPARVRRVPPIFPSPIARKTSSYPSTPVVANRSRNPIRKPKSPTRFTMNAFLPASAADFFSNQNPMSA